MHETVGARYIGDDQNYYERWLEIYFKQCEQGNGRLEEIPPYKEDYSEGGGSPNYQQSDSEIIKQAKRRYNIGDIVNVEFRREGALGYAANLGGIPIYVENKTVTSVTLEKRAQD